MEQKITPATVRKMLTVKADPAKAFNVFVRRIHEWSPASHSLTGARTGVIIEPRVGGRWYETGEGGAEANWGKVIEWEPPHRLLLAWQLDARCAYDPELITEIEVLFRAVAEGKTQVEFEHRNIERFGTAAADVLASLDGKDGWGGSLAQFAALIERERLGGEEDRSVYRSDTTAGKRATAAC